MTSPVNLVRLAVAAGKVLPPSSRGYYLAVMRDVMARGKLPDIFIAALEDGLGIHELSPNEDLFTHWVRAAEADDEETCFRIAQEFMACNVYQEAMAALEGVHACVEFLREARTKSPNRLPLGTSLRIH